MKQILFLFLLSILTFSLSAQTEVCDGGTAKLDAGVGYLTYQWSNGGGNAQEAFFSSPGTYTVTVTDANECTGTATHTVTFCNPITATTSSVDNTSCGTPNGTATVTASGGCSGGLTYSWSTTPSQTTATATGLAAGTYTVTVTSTTSSGCTCSITESVTVSDNVTSPTPTISGGCNN